MYKVGVALTTLLAGTAFAAVAAKSGMSVIVR